ncbi:fluoride efflux transporter CrcB [Streptomyces profundus]|uniref:fluoride efflux transporter CrcB n=1 Tax=Streptomyces profundus TaxID=2867410 RepID=UPI001D15E4FE|nr:fluoride efflux transporter CrcB [Streptomyces sp. MA3_2.13]UED85936.1 fluoride efflux transporter CrcB [Streptomyces sp. MA3_2.13]
MTDYLLVALGGAVGAPLRYGVDRAIRARRDSPVPWGTFLVNVVGSLVLGLLAGAALAGATGERLGLLLGTGLCGALTTYSTFSYEALRLVETGAGRIAAGYVLGSVGAGFTAAFAGHALGRLCWG